LCEGHQEKKESKELEEKKDEKEGHKKGVLLELPYLF
jgi:hypothetical protein